MKKIIKQKAKKTIETIETVHTPPFKLRPVFSFMGSFIIIVGFVLGGYWYGKQIYKSASLLFRAPLIARVSMVKNSQNTQYYDPLNLFEDIKNNNSNKVVLDIRSAQEYTVAHVKNAISLPSYTLENDRITYFDLQEIIQKIKFDKSKHIIMYGPSTSFQYQQIVLAELKRNGFSSQLLAVGWNELRHFHNMWIPEGLWGKIDVNSIVESNDGM